MGTEEWGIGVEKSAAVVEDALHHLGRGFADYHLVSSEEGDDGVGALLDELDQFGIDDEGVPIQPGKFNHEVPAFLSSRKVIGERRESLSWRREWFGAVPS
jgi:hypothetical protein